MKWEDETSYSRNEPYSERKPRSWSLELTRHFVLWVGSDHIDYKGQWVAHCEPFFRCLVLNMPAEKFTAEQAQAAALKLVRKEVEKVNAALAAA